jgi:hypothetical protein
MIPTEVVTYVKNRDEIFPDFRRMGAKSKIFILLDCISFVALSSGNNLLLCTLRVLSGQR